MKKTLRALAPDLNYNSGALVKIALPGTATEDSALQPWRLISAATANTGVQPWREQEMFNALPFGTAPFSRTGNKIVCKGLQLHLKIQSYCQKDVAVRYALVQKYNCDNQSVADLTDEDNNPYNLRGTEITAASLNMIPPATDAINNGIMAMRNLNGTKDFRILLDKKVILRQQTNTLNVPCPESHYSTQQSVDPHLYGEASVVDAVPRAMVYKDHYIDLKDMVTTYSFTGDSAVSNNYQYMEHNGIYLIACTDYVADITGLGSGIPQPTITGSWRLCYLP